MHEFFMAKKYISVRIFSSIVVVNSAQLIFKKGCKNLAENPPNPRNLQLSFSHCNVFMMKCQVPKNLLFNCSS